MLDFARDPLLTVGILYQLITRKPIAAAVDLKKPARPNEVQPRYVSVSVACGYYFQIPTFLNKIYGDLGWMRILTFGCS